MSARRVRGWRIDRIPGRPARRAEDGHVVVPLWLLRDGEHQADLPLVLSPAEAELLHAQLCRVLDGQAPPRGGPECRQSVHVGPSARRPM